VITALNIIVSPGLQESDNDSPITNDPVRNGSWLSGAKSQMPWFVYIPMISGFIMVECDVGREMSTYEALRKMPWITEVHPLFGEFDFILRVQAQDADELARSILTDLRKVPGIISTKTYLEASFGPEPVN